MAFIDIKIIFCFWRHNHGGSDALARETTVNEAAEPLPTETVHVGGARRCLVVDLSIA